MSDLHIPASLRSVSLPSPFPAPLTPPTIPLCCLHPVQSPCLTPPPPRSQLKYKRRVYKMLKLDERQLRAAHSRTNLRRIVEHVLQGNADKVAKLCAKGLDPNFHCPETGGK